MITSEYLICNCRFQYIPLEALIHEEVIKPQSVVLVPVLGPLLPERILLGIRMLLAVGVDPAGFQ